MHSAQTYRAERINYKQNIADGLTIYTYKKNALHGDFLKHLHVQYIAVC